MAIQWSLVIFSLLAAAAAALLVFIGLAEITGKGKKAGFPASIIAIVLLLAGGIAAVMHLGNPGNVMSAVGNLFSLSGISLELIFLGLCLISAVVFAIASKRDSEAVAKAIGVIGLILGLIFCLLLGSSYMLGARPAWNNIGLPLSYMGSGLAIGAFLFMAIAGVLKEEPENVTAIGLWSLIAAIVALIAYLVYGLLSGVATDGSFALLFWVVSVLIGAAVPLCCGALVFKDSKKVVLGSIGLIAAIIGAAGFRILMWVVGSGVLDIFGAGNSNQPF